MNVDVVLSDRAQEKIELTGRFVTVLKANYGIEIRAKGSNTFEVDDADEIDFGHEYANGGEIWIKNISNQQNAVTIASASFYVRRKKSVELTADLSSISIADGTVGFDTNHNEVKVTNKVELEASQVVKVKQQGVVEIEPSQILKVKHDGAIVLPDSIRYLVSYVSHTITGGEVATGWTFNNSTADRLIIKASFDVSLGFSKFAEGEKLKLYDLAPNQDFIFKGVAGDEITIIKMVAV